MAHHRYLVALGRPWAEEVWQERISRFPGAWVAVHSLDQLTEGFIRTVKPRWCFFLHWSWRVPEAIIEAYDCVNFHMTALPYGRGGSPLQHLILCGHTETLLTAHRMTRELDAGPIYLQRPLPLDGSAETIYRRAMHVAADMIQEMLAADPAITPRSQEGAAVRWRRRRPEESEIPFAKNVKTLYDFIRMLDAEGYPRAFLRHKGFRYEFAEAEDLGPCIEARVRITPCAW